MYGSKSSSYLLDIRNSHFKNISAVTEDTDVEELLDLVISVGRSVQENSRVLDTMSEIVKKVNKFDINSSDHNQWTE